MAVVVADAGLVTGGWSSCAAVWLLQHVWQVACRRQAPHLYSSLASQGVLVSVMLPARTSLPITMSAALGAAAGAAVAMQATGCLLARCQLRMTCGGR